MRVAATGRAQRGPYTGRGASTAGRRQAPLLASLFIHPRYAGADSRENFITNCLRLHGKIIGGNHRRSLSSDKHCLISRRDGRDVRNIHNGKIHADPSDDRDDTVMDEDTATIRKRAAVAIGVADGQDRERRRPGGDEGAAVAHRVSRRDPLHLHNLSFPT